MSEFIDEKKKKIAALIKIEGVSEEEVYSSLVVPQDLSLGDYALPCFKFAKLLRKAPQMIADTLAKDINADEGAGVKAQAVNGYLNFSFDKASETGRTLSEIINKGANYGEATLGNGKTVCIDYSSINIAKPFHIGHLSTTVIGAALYRIYKKLGFNVVGINHLGDWGTQFGKLIVAYKLWGNREDVEKRGVTALNELYVRFHAEAENDDTLNDKARHYFKLIEDGNEEATELFKLFKEITLKEVKVVYDRLNITFDSWNGEAFYNDKMAPVLEELEQKGLIKESEGAKIVDLSEYNMAPCLLVRSDGATLYATRDLAAAFYRKKTYDFYKCLYVVAYQQNLHFKQFFKVIELMGYDWYKGLVHVNFGMVSLADGTMSTRKGKVVLLNDLFDRAIEKSLAIIAEKSPNLKNKEEVSERVGLGAVVFFALSNNRIKDIVFSYDKVLNFDGETAPYVQYTNARCNSVLKNLNTDVKSYLSAPFTAEELSAVTDSESQAVVALLSRFQNILADAADKYEPSILTRYVIDLAQAYNKFYLENRILNAPEATRRARAGLTYATGTVLTEAMRILGVTAVEEM